MFNDSKVVGCSWTDLTQRLDRNGTVARWSGTERALVGLSTVDELVAAWRNPVRTDEVLSALGRLAAVDGGGDDEALLVLLHLLSGVVWRLVSQLRDFGPDVLAVVLSELTCQVRTFRWRS